MAEEIQAQQSTKKTISIMEEMMEEVRLLFGVGVLAMWGSLWICDTIGMPEAFPACAAQLGLMFAAVTAKAGWGKDA